MNPETHANSPSSKWLIRIPEVFSELTGEILQNLEINPSISLGQEYHLVSLDDLNRFERADGSRFVRWKMPVDHSWPCNPQNMQGFVEKAAQAMSRKFAAREPQNLLIGLLDPSTTHRYYKSLASNLRGRALQLFPAMSAADSAELQAPEKPTLFCLLGKEGLFCGMISPQAANGFYAGGTRYISHTPGSAISRAGAKIAEALHYLGLHSSAPDQGAHWLELGASPGGMTSELLQRNYRVTALDRAALDVRLTKQPNLQFHQADVGSFKPKPGTRFDAILSDMNGDAVESIRQVIRLSGFLKDSGLIIFTLKTSGSDSFSSMIQLAQNVENLAAAASLKQIARTHLTYNRQEFTLFFRKAEKLKFPQNDAKEGS